MGHIGNHFPLNHGNINHAAKLWYRRSRRREDKEYNKFLRSVSDHLGFGSDLKSLHKYMHESFALYEALVQVGVSSYLALIFLGPLYAQRGLGAAVGAHMAWNILDVPKFLLSCLVPRLFIGLNRNLTATSNFLCKFYIRDDHSSDAETIHSKEKP